MSGSGVSRASRRNRRTGGVGGSDRRRSRPVSTTGTCRARGSATAPVSGPHSSPADAGSTATPAPAHWASSEDPSHWNSWRREADAYRDPALRASLVGTGLAMPAADVVEHPGGATLLLEDVTGTAGPDFALEDHVATAAALGRWHGPRCGPRDSWR